MSTSDILTDDLDTHEPGQGKLSQAASKEKTVIDKHPIFDFSNDDRSDISQGYSRFKNSLAAIFQSLQSQIKKLTHFGQTHALLASIGAFFVIVMLIGASVLFFTRGHQATITANHDDPKIAHLVENMDDIQGKLLVIEQELKSHPNNTQNDTAKLDAKISALTTSVTQLASQMNQTISASLQNNDEKLNAQLSAVSQRLDAMKEARQPIQYLKPSDLPFETISIDSIEGQPVVSVTYDYKTSPLDVGFTLAGWTLLSANYAKQRAEFINKQHQHVVIQLDKLEA